jgi:uncharacterized protein
MLFGMALLKWAFLGGKWSRRSYWRLVALGYGLGLPLVAYSFYHTTVHNPTMEAALTHMDTQPVPWIRLIYPFQRLLLVMAHASLIILIFQGNGLKNLGRRFAAVGKMAFTNYITHTIICSLVFFGYGLNYFAEMPYYQIYLLALGIWIFQLILSPWWLERFQFGPLEWLWRSLTYWKAQPFRRFGRRGRPGIRGRGVSVVQKIVGVLLFLTLTSIASMAAEPWQPEWSFETHG